MLTAENILPIGSVVHLGEDHDHCFAIVGYGLRTEEHCFDYAAVLYPLGEDNDNKVRPFDAEDIGEVVFAGYKGPEGKTFAVTREYVLAIQNKSLNEVSEPQTEESNTLE